MPSFQVGSYVWTVMSNYSTHSPIFGQSLHCVLQSFKSLNMNLLEENSTSDVFILPVETFPIATSSQNPSLDLSHKESITKTNFS